MDLDVPVESIRSYWDAFYRANRGSQSLLHESPFAAWTAERLEEGSQVLDFGCGTGRDSMYFASLGHLVTGFDCSAEAIEIARREATTRGHPAHFEVLDLADLEIARTKVELSVAEDVPTSCYARFLLHATGNVERNNLLEISASVLGQGGLLFLEFRTVDDARTMHAYGEEHFRNYLRPDLVREEIVEHGGKVLSCDENRGLAPFEGEDPVICRLVATWRGPA